MRIYDDVRPGSQPINMKIRDSFQLSVSDDPAQFPGIVTPEMLLDFGLRGQEPTQFLDILKQATQEQDWQQLKMSDKLSKLFCIIGDMNLDNSLRPWRARSSISQMMDLFHICDDDLLSDDGRSWCSSVLSLSAEETETFNSKVKEAARRIPVSTQNADVWRQSLNTKMKQQLFGHPGEVLLKLQPLSFRHVRFSYSGKQVFGKRPRVQMRKNGGIIIQRRRRLNMLVQRVSKQLFCLRLKAADTRLRCRIKKGAEKPTNWFCCSSFFQAK